MFVPISLCLICARNCSFLPTSGDRIRAKHATTKRALCLHCKSTDFFIKIALKKLFFIFSVFQKFAAFAVLLPPACKPPRLRGTLAGFLARHMAFCQNVTFSLNQNG